MINWEHILHRDPKSEEKFGDQRTNIWIGMPLTTEAFLGNRGTIWNESKSKKGAVWYFSKTLMGVVILQKAKTFQ